MVSQTFTQPAAQDAIEQDSDRFDAREFWARLDWDYFCFPERYLDLLQQHRDAGLDPRDEGYLDVAPLGGYQRPTTFTSSSGRTVCID